VTCDCPKDRQPVCSVQGHTFDNACMALCNNQAVAYEGPCTPKAHTTSCNCPSMTYNPVCGLDLQTYPSSCQAACAGVRAPSPAASRAASRALQPQHRAGCGRLGRPLNRGQGLPTDLPGCPTAACAQVGIAYYGLCKPEWSARLAACDCSGNYLPVCSSAPGNSGSVTFGSSCIAHCLRMPTSYGGECRPGR
jgi:hypothetical protein